MKILYVTTIGITMGFFKNFIKTLLDAGHIIDIATNESDSKVPDCYREWNCNIYHIDTSRSPLDLGNINAIRQIKNLVDNNAYDVVHCHTPIAAICTRLACRKARKHGTKVIYTAHGFHFYKGAPLKNWLIYYPAEKLCAHFTDTLITINQEDYNLACKKMRAKRIEYVPGVGIDLNKFSKKYIDAEKKRRTLGIDADFTILLSVGELNENKNHETVIRAIKDLKNVYYVIAGKGDLQSHLQDVINKLGLSNRVKLLGFRNDIDELCNIADIFVFPSIREGLGLSAIEGMACGLPLIIADNRGTRDFCQDGVNGFVCKPTDVEAFTKTIRKLSNNQELQLKMSKNNIEKAKMFEQSLVNNRLMKIYKNQGEFC